VKVAFDVTCLDDATVVVSTNTGIEIIDINSTKTKRCIKTSKPCRGSLISLIDFTVGCCITDTICACLSFVVLITTDGRLVSIDTDPNVVIVDSVNKHWYRDNRHQLYKNKKMY
jgi:hypothetical protein